MRTARFQILLLYLALAATLLMALAPVVSRWVQAGHVQHTRAMTLPGAHAGHAAMTDAAHAHHLAGHAPAAAPTKAPPDPHAAHGEACDYCTMASRLLPWLAVLLVLAPSLYRLAPASPRSIQLPPGLRWPAHPVRGPPLFS
ncbi:MAG: DUF2946 family protein [Stenotrophomonas sp.]